MYPLIALVVLLVLVGLYFTLRPDVADITPPPSNVPSESSTTTPPSGTSTSSAIVELEGFIVRNNPGLTPDTWYLLYDQPGAPGRTIELDFGNSTTPTLTVGARMYVTGELTGDVLLVERITTVPRK